MLPLKNLFPEWECKGSKIFLNANILVKFIPIFAVPLARDCFLLNEQVNGDVLVLTASDIGQ